MIAFLLLSNLDRGLEAGMVTDPRPSIREQLRDLLGTDHLHTHLHRMEIHMSEITDSLNRLAEQVNGVSAAQATAFHNLQTALDDLKAGKLTAEQQEIVSRIESSLTKLGEDAQAGDDGYEPVGQPQDGEQPADENPTGDLNR